ncbi:hypothetical protein INT43_005952 [Umbelopsis isabellina]|uniref:Sodium/sulfate symporter n=1 Tax=Mortierella isabellina TaxID=91625 RepID=A0A8H7U9Q1_MORIS|nr:hypothetical protein INT43_005952 [Umbelopsis isabellina]
MTKKDDLSLNDSVSTSATESSPLLGTLPVPRQIQYTLLVNLDNLIQFILKILEKCKHNKLVQLLPSLIVGLAIWFGVPDHDELTPTAIHILAVFMSSIVALLTTRLDMSLIVLFGLVILSLTRSFQCTDAVTGGSVECRLCQSRDPISGDLYHCDGRAQSFRQSLEGFSTPVVWLIFAAFHLGRAVDITRLGKRASVQLIQLFGTSTLGLAYSIEICEVVLAPFVPSNTARGGGIVLPVVSSLTASLGSTVDQDPQLGALLSLVGAHSNLVSASLFMTGMAANPLVVSKAKVVFPHINFNFVRWTIGASVPALVSLILMPILFSWWCDTRRQIGSGEQVKNLTEEQLKELGPIATCEKMLCIILVICLMLWVGSDLDSGLVALLGILLLLLTDVLTWKDVAGNTNAWDTLFWLGGFVTIAQQLSDAGASAYLGEHISTGIDNMGLPPIPTIPILYFATCFMFSSLSTHIVALNVTFMEAGKHLGVNPMILVPCIAYFSSLGGCMTNFSTGSVAMYYSQGFIGRGRWFALGARVAVLHLVVYFTVGVLWWRCLGWLE